MPDANSTRRPDCVRHLRGGVLFSGGVKSTQDPCDRTALPAQHTGATFPTLSHLRARAALFAGGDGERGPTEIAPASALILRTLRESVCHSNAHLVVRQHLIVPRGPLLYCPPLSHRVAPPGRVAVHNRLPPAPPLPPPGRLTPAAAAAAARRSKLTWRRRTP